MYHLSECPRPYLKSLILWRMNQNRIFSFSELCLRSASSLAHKVGRKVLGNNKIYSLHFWPFPRDRYASLREGITTFSRKGPNGLIIYQYCPRNVKFRIRIHFHRTGIVMTLTTRDNFWWDSRTALIMFTLHWVNGQY